MKAAASIFLLTFKPEQLSATCHRPYLCTSCWYCSDLCYDSYTEHTQKLRMSKRLLLLLPFSTKLAYVISLVCVVPGVLTEQIDDFFLCWIRTVLFPQASATYTKAESTGNYLELLNCDSQESYLELLVGKFFTSLFTSLLHLLFILFLLILLY